MVATYNVTGNYSNPRDWTRTVVNLDNQYGFIRSQPGLFNMIPVDSDTVMYDYTTNEIVMMPNVNPHARQMYKGKDDTVYPIAMALEFFENFDYIGPDDLNHRQTGTINTKETLSNARARKLQNLRLSHDQRDEFLRFNALAGNLRPWLTGNRYSNIYEMFGTTASAYTVNLGITAASTSATLDTQINTMEHLLADNLKNGQAMTGIMVICSTTMFNDFIENTSYREVWLNRNSDELTRNLATYYKWGVTHAFTFRGITFVEYNPTFNLRNADGSTSTATVLDEGTGIAIPTGVTDLFRGYYGPNYKLQQQSGSEMYVYEWADQNGEDYTLQIQSRKAFHATKPAIVQLSVEAAS